MIPEYSIETTMVLFVGLLALVWGVVWALFVQLTRLGQFLTMRRTWLTVVIGVGADLVILALVVPLVLWLVVMMVVALSSVGIIARGLYNEFHETEELLNDLKDPRAE